nr:M15 family metallopeptidase [Salsipaludibacter albus]
MLALVVLTWLVVVGAVLTPPAEARVTAGDDRHPGPGIGLPTTAPSPAPTAAATVESSPAASSSPSAAAAPSTPATPAPTVDHSTSPAPTPRPRVDLSCEGEVETVAIDPATGWQDVVVDPVRRLPEAWAPDDLVEVEGVGYDGSPAPRVRELVVDDLAAMHEAASRAGARFVVVSAFRSQDHQARVWDRAVASEGGVDAARAGTAPPGHSEHQLGTTIDVVDPGLPELDAGLAETPAGHWLAVHAVEFGFVVSYPDGATARTCYKPEPWHLRYVGRERAAAMAAFPLSPREFLLDRATRAPASTDEPS